MRKILTALAVSAALVLPAAPAQAATWPDVWHCGTDVSGSQWTCSPVLRVKARNERNAITVAKARWFTAVYETTGLDIPDACTGGAKAIPRKKHRYKVSLICRVPALP